MTDQEMRDRMKEIDEERDTLRKEREKYEKYFYDKKSKEKAKDHEKYIGKCFVSKNISENEEKHIKAFKILKVLEHPNEDCVECITLIDGYRYTCWNEFGVQHMTLPLWTPNDTGRFLHAEPDPLMIDFYEEVTQDDFNKLYTSYKSDIESKINF